MEFCTDVIDEIFGHVKPVDAYNFSLTSKYNHKFSDVKKCIISAINIRLIEIFSDEYNNFMQALKLSDSVISGSFIIQCIIDEDWESDVDIYTKTFKNNLFSYLGESQFNITEDYKNLEIDGLYNYFINKYTISEELSISYKIQVIVNESKNIEKIINDNFDFDVCQNYFDGDNIHIKNLSSIINKLIDLKGVKYTSFTSDRYNKYKNRGFTTINEDKMDISECLIYKSNSAKINNLRTVPDSIVKQYPILCNDYTNCSNPRCMIPYIFKKSNHIHFCCENDTCIEIIVSPTIIPDEYHVDKIMDSIRYIVIFNKLNYYKYATKIAKTIGFVLTHYVAEQFGQLLDELTQKIIDIIILKNHVNNLVDHGTCTFNTKTLILSLKCILPRSNDLFEQTVDYIYSNNKSTIPYSEIKMCNYSFSDKLSLRMAMAIEYIFLCILAQVTINTIRRNHPLYPNRVKTVDLIPQPKNVEILLTKLNVKFTPHSNQLLKT